MSETVTAFYLSIVDDAEERAFQSPWAPALKHRFFFGYDCLCGKVHLDEGEAVLRYNKAIVVEAKCSAGFTTAVRIEVGPDPVESRVEQTMQDLRGVRHQDF